MRKSDDQPGPFECGWPFRLGEEAYTYGDLWESLEAGSPFRSRKGGIGMPTAVKRRRPGRPSLGVEKVSLHLTHEQVDFLYALANFEGNSVSHAARILVDEAVAARKARDHS